MTTNTIAAAVAASNAAILASNAAINARQITDGCNVVDAVILCGGTLIFLSLCLIDILELKLNGKSFITKIKEWIIEVL